ncbi:MAG: hypothetical protein E6K70_20560 [Planctomycetota bacterium]|nr:MAG: hypothetical protein E6K70_20560 [Planctomycetota bacterium]
MIIDCPSCSRKLRVPDSLLGKQVRCPTCGHQFEAAAAAGASAPEAEAQPAPPPLDAPLNLELEAPSPASDPTREAPAPPVTPRPATLSPMRPSAVLIAARAWMRRTTNSSALQATARPCAATPNRTAADSFSRSASSASSCPRWVAGRSACPWASSPGSWASATCAKSAKT